MNWALDSISKYWPHGVVAIAKSASAVLAICALWQFLNSPYAPPLLIVGIISAAIAYVLT
jgi:hypothetical protein